MRNLRHEVPEDVVLIGGLWSVLAVHGSDAVRRAKLGRAEERSRVRVHHVTHASEPQPVIAHDRLEHGRSERRGDLMIQRIELRVDPERIGVGVHLRLRLTEADEAGDAHDADLDGQIGRCAFVLGFDFRDEVKAADAIREMSFDHRDVYGLQELVRDFREGHFAFVGYDRANCRVGGCVHHPSEMGTV